MALVIKSLLGFPSLSLINVIISLKFRPTASFTDIPVISSATLLKTKILPSLSVAKTASPIDFNIASSLVLISLTSCSALLRSVISEMLDNRQGSWPSESI
ncbi:MAG: hypothetical protein ACD_22C00104G0001 [uncultured bacterium]|nr:MAG: hypothetical protein ACD_22C00104G0001 [uncultured bacterium]